MRKHIIMFGLAALMAASACTKMNPDTQDDGQMRFIPGLPATKASDSAFESGDAFGVYAVEYNGAAPAPLQISGNWANNAKSAFDGTKWTVTPPIWWKDEAKFDVFAYYPYNENPKSVDNYLFEVQTDQRQQGYTLSDLMWASAKGVVQSGGAIPLNFKHKLSRLDINLIKGEDFEGDLPATAEVRVMNTVSSAILSMETGDVEKNPYGVEKTILAKQTGVGKFTAIIVPQKLMNQVPLLEIIVNEVSYLVSTRLYFESGKRHTIDVVMSSDPNKALINIGGKIDSWN